MGVTKIDELNAPQARVYIAAQLPTTPQAYYSTNAHDVDSVAWRGGEMAYNTSDNRHYIQTATSGVTATWKRFLDATVAA
jgi:hypothetical protein